MQALSCAGQLQTHPRMKTNRDQCVQEYFELIRQLNSANKLKDQKTDVYFFIKTEGIEAKLCAAISESQKIYLCYRVKINVWFPGKISRYSNLEQFICTTLNREYEKDLDLTNFIKSHLFKLS